MSIHVNGVTIESRDINIDQRTTRSRGPIRAMPCARAAVALTVRELLRQRAEQLGIDTTGDEAELDAALDDLVEREVHVPAADTETCRRWYLQNPDQFRTPDLAEVRHILLAAPPDILEERDAARATAEELIARLQQDPDAFPQLARSIPAARRARTAACWAR
jgi:peptidyl-prolyl cis-trans isomerase C